jgi:predicted P-loop ATPase
MTGVHESRQAGTGNLSQADYAALERSYITPELADAAGIYRVASLEGRAIVGRKDGGDYSGIVFPYRMPGETYSVLERLRLDNPPVDAATGQPQHKYLTAHETRNRLYFPPSAAALAGDAAVPLVITEGEKKCLALWRMALETGAPAFLPVALAGVWGWKATIGTRTNARGERVSEKGPLPDLDRILWNGRIVSILFDANAASNPSVAAARRHLACELTRRGALVFLVDLPAAVGVNGCDDYLYQFGVPKLAQVLKQAARYEWKKDLIVSDKGKPLAVLANGITALRGAPEWCGGLAFDEFSLSVTAMRPTPWGYLGKWDEQCDRLLANWLQHHGIRLGDTEAAKAAEAVARDRSFHPVREYLDGLKWDQTERISRWLTTYLGAEESDLTAAMGAKWLISAVARIYQPGCKADHMLIAEGPQGLFKSSAFRALAEPWFTDDIADLGSKDSQLATLGVWIIELPELDAMGRSELSRVKAFMSRNTDRFRPPYGRRLIESPRQCIFVGTVNQGEYLRDETGGRRFWPAACGYIDLEALRRDKDQLWAEAAARYRKKETWWLDTTELNKAATEEQDARYQVDAWESTIADWMETLDAAGHKREEVTTAQILTGPLDKKIGLWTRSDETRVGIILRRLGWKPGGHARPRTYRPQPTSTTGS